MSGKQGANAKDITGQRFGRMVALRDIGRDAKNGRVWEFQCDCGNLSKNYLKQVSQGTAISCGCAQREAAASLCLKRKKHGYTGKRIYNIWRTMIARCGNPKSISYKRYGARGISVCAQWLDFATFAEWAFSNGYAANLSIDRKENDKGYSPDNCRWATVREQGTNRSTTNLIEFEGYTLSETEWAEKIGIGRTALRYRLSSGWPLEIALTRGKSNGKKWYQQ